MIEETPFKDLKDSESKSLFKHHKQQAKQSELQTQLQQFVPVDITKVISVDS